MKKVIPFVCFLAILAPLCLGCASGQNQQFVTTAITKYNETATDIKVKVGEQFEIDLAANVTTGYTWDGNEVYDKTMLELVKKEYITSGQQRPGAGGTQMYMFKALKAGDTQIKMTYKRSWETTDSDKTIIFKVSIK